MVDLVGDANTVGTLVGYLSVAQTCTFYLAPCCMHSGNQQPKQGLLILLNMHTLHSSLLHHCHWQWFCKWSMICSYQPLISASICADHITLHSNAKPPLHQPSHHTLAMPASLHIEGRPFCCLHQRRVRSKYIYESIHKNSL